MQGSRLQQQQLTPDRLAEALVPLFGDTAERRQQLADFARLDALMEIGTAWPARRAADAVLAAVGRRKPESAGKIATKQ